MSLPFLLVFIDFITFFLMAIFYKIKTGSIKNYLRQELLLIDNKLALRLGISSNSDLSISSCVAHAHYYKGLEPTTLALKLADLIDWLSYAFFSEPDHILKSFEPNESNNNPLIKLYKIKDEDLYYSQEKNNIEKQFLN